MRSFIYGLITATAYFTHALAVTTSRCDSNCTFITYHISSQEDLQQQLAKNNVSTNLCGTLNLDDKFSGPLLLNNITEICGILTAPSYAGAGPGLTSIVANELVSISGLNLKGVKDLRSIEMPKLTNLTGAVKEIWIEGSQHANLSLGALEEASTLYLFGGFDRVEFSHLQNVDMMTIESHPDNSSNTPGQNSWDFPELAMVRELTLIGNFGERISLPSLHTLGQSRTDRPSDPQSQAILTFSSRVEVEFPKLIYATSIHINGTVTYLSVPSLVTVSGALEITPDLDIQFGASFKELQTATSIKIEGNITNVSFPALKHITDFHLFSSDSASINCDVYEKEYKPLTGGSFQCGYLPASLQEKKKGTGMSQKTKLAIGLCVGLPLGLALIGFVVWDQMRMMKKKKAPAKLEGEGAKYEPFRGEGETARGVESDEHELRPVR